MDQFHLRPATHKDTISIRKLVRAERLNPISLDWQRFVVAISSAGELIGCGQVKPHQRCDGSTAFELASIVVKPSWRGKRIAQALIKHLLTQYDPPIYLTCRASLGAFYERVGFLPARTAKLPTYFQLARLFIGILHRFGITDEELLVMSYGDPENEEPSIEDR
jgi:N-acetylglutamate synthase-like GNAT family acetyltransferase